MIKNLVIKTIATAIIALGTAISAHASAEGDSMLVQDEQEIRVIVGGEPVEFDVPPQIIDGEIMVPMRAIFEALDLEMEWDEEAQTITTDTRNSLANNVIWEIGSTIITKLNEGYTSYSMIDVPPK